MARIRTLYRSVVLVCVVVMGTDVPANADEIRLKDGKKVSGVIVAYEDKMFKVKTDYGYVLIEKDKIASITPSAQSGRASKTDSSEATKTEAAKAAVEAAKIAAGSKERPV